MEPISEQAARWVVRAADGTLDPEQQRELDVWLNADPRNRGAYIRARAQWVDLDRLAALHGPASSEATKRESGVRISRRVLLAAGVAAIAVGGLSWMALRDSKERYASGIGEVRRIALEDGSTLLLNTDSEVTVWFSKHRRNIQLIRGEALFEVAHDRERPFFVEVNDVVVRAVGTAFAVRLEAAQVDVTVTEGVVEVTEPAAAPGSAEPGPSASRSETRRVAANERAIITHARAPQVHSITPAEADRRLAWRQGMVSFDGESLQMAVAEINRHNRRQIIVDDPALGAKPIVGVFRATDPSGFSVAAALALKATVVPDAEIIRIRPATAQTPN
ncbi:MAG: FecR domain-containing protein [Steroidobacteraceae bacterium]